jgi:rRNA maturation RNase YbeY
MSKCEVFIEGDVPARLNPGKRRLKAAAEYFAARSAARCGTAFRQVAVVLQDDEASDEAHRAIMDVAGATDVITQRYDPMPGEPPGIYGELYVNVERSVAAASSRGGWNAEKELLLYVAHGMDHLSGEDDLDEAARMRMRRRELGWLKDFYAATAGGAEK